MSKVLVLRLGHRPLRDKRITTHVGLVARSFGADGLILTVDDESVVESIEDVKERWGGEFFVKVVNDWRRYLKSWGGVVVHLTMYGMPVDEKIDEIRRADSNVLVVVGAEKVPPEVYKLAHYNIAVGLQPHSEVAAIAIFLDRYFKGEQLEKDFKGRTRIIPSGDGKRAVIE
ncbi:MAG: tRNA (cytidine(56)-2'-O)-methyltransferase [Candidatus Hydrothermarchaeales archaeon]